MLKFYQLFIQYLAILSTTAAANIAFKLFCTPVNKKLRDREIEVLKTVQSENVPFENTFIKKYAWGNGNKTALLVHG